MHFYDFLINFFKMNVRKRFGNTIEIDVKIIVRADGNKTVNSQTTLF